MLHPELLASANAIAGDIVALRRAIHAEPELGLHTPLTQAKVRAALADLPLEWRSGPSTTGEVAILRGGKPGHPGRSRVLLRGDMDALPMPEQTGLDFASTIDGRMHACGHDTHTAMLVGAAQVLAARQAELAGEVMFMFQPGEEGYHGARFMMEDGLLGGTGGNPLPEAAFALHIMPNARHGVIAGRAGALLAAADQFEITLEGRGGHASMPHDTLDPVPAACAVVTALQTVVTRRFNAADAVVVTVTMLDAGTAHNVIPDHAVLRGTMRTLSPENRRQVQQLMRETASGIAAAHGVTARVEITEGFPVTLCDERAVAMGRSVTHEVLGADSWKDLPAPIMGAEDFSYVLEQVPGAMFFLGVAPSGEDWSQCCGIHSSRMMVDEGALPLGTAILAGCAMRFLERGFE
ncbi:M20 family metallopeptidase [Allopontixanthobacter sp.]|uniref:M20 metallopeptidase family protein n=1 Tax=Allopontixanthobacter sp. TaxID=2906452 RepID=UPI002AB90494|nr:M20 family metallopeptidase [Allopontixanthobacter sp.]MDZ4306883.1 M20 family metallopeptidase [Allopontixanthobacter sp.]